MNPAGALYQTRRMLDKFLHVAELGHPCLAVHHQDVGDGRKARKPELAPAIYEACLGLGLRENLQTLSRAERQAWFGPSGASQNCL